MIDDSWLVEIKTKDGFGSGIVVSTHGHILTCYHNIYTKQGVSRTIETITARKNNIWDTTPIKGIKNNIVVNTPEDDLPFAKNYDLVSLLVGGDFFSNTKPPLRIDRLPKKGEKVYLLSCDNRTGGEYRKSSLVEIIDVQHGGNNGVHFRIEYHGYKGMSGGGVFTETGELLGIVKKIDSERTNEILAVPVNLTQINAWIPSYYNEENEKQVFGKIKINSNDERQIDLYAESISSSIVDQRVIFFVGDTTSHDQHLGEIHGNNQPTFQKPLINHLKEDFENDLIESFGEQFVISNFAYLSQQIFIAKNRDILHSSLIRFFEEKTSAIPIYEWLSEIAKANEAINKKMLANGPYQRMLIVLSSPDNMLEKLLKEKEIPFHLLCFVQGKQQGKDRIVHYDVNGEEHDVPKVATRYGGLGSDKHLVVLKMYGDIDKVREGRSNLIATEDDYINLAGKNLVAMLPKLLSAIFMHNESLFIKYDINDWNLRVILFRLWQAYSSPKNAWAITNNRKQGDKDLWKNFGVDLINNQNISMFMDKVKEKINQKLCQ